MCNMNVETSSQAVNAAVDYAAQVQSGKSAARAETVTQAAPVVQEAAPPPSLDAVKASAAHIDSYLKSVGRNLNISVDKETGKTIVQVRDAETGDVIRQIPNEEVLRLARSLGENGAAILDLKA
jgi:flagellar protein FlaG